MAADDDWKAIRARKWQAEKQQGPTVATAAAQPDKAASASSSQSAATRIIKQSQSTLLPELGHSWQRAAAAGLVVLVMAMMLHSLVHQHSMNARLNQSDTDPDARLRPAHAHRAYILNKHDFVHIYSRRSASEAEKRSKAIEGSDMWGADFDLLKGGITRCTTTQYAMTTYFCGKIIADTDKRLRRITSAAALRAYIKEIDGIVQNPTEDTCTLWPELVLRFNVAEAADEHLGHTFVMHFLPEGGVQVYQSFITYYTLHSYLKNHGPLDAAGLEAFISNLEAITNASVWSPREDAAYKANFLVSLGGDNAKVAVGVVGASSRRGPWGRSGENIVVMVEPACLVAPWAGPLGESIIEVTQAFLE